MEYGKWNTENGKIIFISCEGYTGKENNNFTMVIKLQLKGIKEVCKRHQIIDGVVHQHDSAERKR